MYTTTAPRLTRAGAMKILESGVAAAEKSGRPVSIAVVDEGGLLLAFTRTDDAEPYGIQIALSKARGAALTRFPTGKKALPETSAVIITPWLSHWPQAPTLL